MSAMPTREELLKRMRKKQDERTSRRRDPDQFSPPQIKDNSKSVFYFRVLPELHKGDKCAGGLCEIDNDLWYYENGAHWYQKERFECPRVHDGRECSLCQLGFDLMESAPDKAAKTQIAQKYLSRQGFAVNVYFLDVKTNPEELRGKVKWFNLPITLWRKMDECISSDDAGDEIDQKAHGIFYHPYEGGYTFKLIAQKKGDWNDYSESSFLPKSFSPLMVASDKNDPDDKTIEEILSKRIVLQTRFGERSVEKLHMLVKKIENIKAGVEDDAEEIDPDDEAAEAPVGSSSKSQQSQSKAAASSTKTQAAPAQAAPAQAAPAQAAPAQAAPAQAAPAQAAPAQEAQAKSAATAVADDPELQELLGSIRSRKK
jgi:hypothetical protein